MGNVKLDNRLAACADFIKEAATVCDVGTDHGLLPVYLAQNGICQSAVACDINEQPLKSAEENIRKYELEDKITTVLSDGLDKISPQGISHIVIAGMGGELIAEIIKRCNWASQCRLVLQPMSRIETMRRELMKVGFAEMKTKAVIEKEHTYIVSLWHYVGKEEEMRFTPLGLTVGKLRPDETSSVTYVRRKIESLMKAALGKLAGDDDRTEAKYYMQLADELQQFIDKKNELHILIDEEEGKEYNE